MRLDDGDLEAWQSLHHGEVYGGALASLQLWQNKARRRLFLQPATWWGERAHGEARRPDLITQGGRSWLEHTWHDDGTGARWSGEADMTSGS